MSVTSLPRTSILGGVAVKWHSHAIGTSGSPGTTAGRTVSFLFSRALFALLPKVRVIAPA
jgi:hypothetical protein